MEGLSYSRMINGLTKTGITINRKFLAELAVSSPAVFAEIAKQAKDALAVK